MKSDLLVLPDESKISLQKELQKHHLELTSDGNAVRWNRDNPKFPRNWSQMRKVYDIGVICLLDLFMYAHSHYPRRNLANTSYAELLAALQV